MEYVGKTITIRPTEGCYQKTHEGCRIVSETGARFVARFPNGKERTFKKSDGRPVYVIDKQFPVYVADLTTIA